MHSISISAMKTMIQHIGMDMREPLMFWGQPGVGKTEGVVQLCAETGGHLVDVRLSQYDSVDLRGIPGIDRGDNLTVWHAPSTLPFKGNKRFSHLQDLPIFLFLDEINSASPPVAAVAYQLVNEKRVGEHELMDNVIVIAAGNRDTDRGVTNRMPLPLANRFTHAEIVVSVDDWSLWAQKAGLPPVGVAFINFRKPLLSTFDPSKPDKAFATPRTWAKALGYYANDKMPTSTKHAAMAGAVGDGPATEFWAFVDIWSKITPIDRILKDPTGVSLPDDKEPGMSYAMAVSVSGHMTKKNITPLHTYLMRLAPEYTVLGWTLAVKRDGTLDETREFIEFAKKHRAIFKG